MKELPGDKVFDGVQQIHASNCEAALALEIEQLISVFQTKRPKGLEATLPILFIFNFQIYFDR